MTAFRRLAWVIVVLVLLAVAGGAWYFFGSNGRSAAQLVPGDTLAFAVIPNGASLGAGFETSKLKQLANAPEAQPLLDTIEQIVGDKNLALLKLLAPDFSGQSFLALTHYDPTNPGETGFVAGLRPKLGTDHFDEFVQQVNVVYPDLAKESKTGHDTLLGVDYQWIQGNNVPGRICVAHYRGWIVTTWGEAALQDFLERLQGKSSTPSLADNADYTKSISRLGGSSQAIFYGSYGRGMDLFLQQFPTLPPGMVGQMKKRFAGLGGLALGSSFDHGEIVDRYSVLEPKQTQLNSGISTTPCAFDTLKFTGPDTRFYTAANVNWQQLWKNYQSDLASMSTTQGKGILDEIQAEAQSHGIDLQKNLIDALGSEYSLQIEWTADAPWPDVAFYLKLDKPDDFKPVVAALIDETRKDFAASAVINEMESSGVHFATLKMINPMPVSPTITEDGPYFAFFLNETHAARSLARDTSRGLLHNDDFNRQIGDQRNGANQIIFLDTPKLLDQSYRAALPWVSLGAMMNQQLAALVQGRKLPPDLAWLAPMGTWSAVGRSDDEGLTGFSISGAGNQGLVLMGGLVSAALHFQQAGMIPQTPTPSAPATTAVTPAPLQLPDTNAPPAAPVTVVPAPQAASTNSPDATTPPPSTH